MSTVPAQATEPPRDCALCPRLHQFIADWRVKEPEWHNAPVPTFLPKGGDDNVSLLIVGLAPGLRGANKSGRPFTGDYAGDLLYSTLKRFGFAEGEYEARPDDSLTLIDAAIVNAVRCVPPENKPVGAEINTCREHFFAPTMKRFKNMKAILTLGVIAHQSTVRALGGRVAEHKFTHGARQDVAGFSIFSSYHCSRYNTNTGRLTEDMFVSVFRDIREFLDN